MCHLCFAQSDDGLKNMNSTIDWALFRKNSSNRLIRQLFQNSTQSKRQIALRLISTMVVHKIKKMEKLEGCSDELIHSDKVHRSKATEIIPRGISATLTRYLEIV